MPNLKINKAYFNRKGCELSRNVWF